STNNSPFGRDTRTIYKVITITNNSTNRSFCDTWIIDKVNAIFNNSTANRPFRGTWIINKVIGIFNNSTANRPFRGTWIINKVIGIFKQHRQQAIQGHLDHQQSQCHLQQQHRQQAIQGHLDQQQSHWHLQQQHHQQAIQGHLDHQQSHWHLQQQHRQQAIQGHLDHRQSHHYQHHHQQEAPPYRRLALVGHRLHRIDPQPRHLKELLARRLLRDKQVGEEAGKEAKSQVFLFCATPTDEPGKEQQNKAVILINLYRTLHGSHPLFISSQLTKEAQSWAENLAQTGQLSHETSMTDGENIAMLQADSKDVQNAIDAWYDEEINMIIPNLDLLSLLAISHRYVKHADNTGNSSLPRIRL
ncbi:hypothetical protein QZH41_009761, partial [Actinostola sp. cb2023]